MPPGVRFIEYEFRACLHCEARRIVQCEERVNINGVDVLPDGCWRKEYIKVGPKPHKEDERGIN